MESYTTTSGAITDIAPGYPNYKILRDVQGQVCEHVYEGDTRKEAYRLSTFRRFPAATSPVLPAPLARSGFYYTGYKDRVKCFSCKIGVENWAEGDDVSDKKWHKADCEFANGRDTTNMPLLAIYKKELEKRRQRRNSFHMQHGASNIIPQASSSITPVSNNGGNYFQGTSSSGVSQSAEPRLIFPTTQQNQDCYPCLHPVNPHMRSAVSRLGSFKERNGIRWPRERLRAGIDDLVNAGFFYLGERDRVKCWYCNGGLQNWDYDDDPWTEHAKWFPGCHYLLRVKGPAFVDGVVKKHPQLNRPVSAAIPCVPSPLHSENISPSRGLDIPATSSNPLTQYRDGHDHAISQATPAVFQQQRFKDINKIKFSKEKLLVGINNSVNAILFHLDSRGLVKCQCRNVGLQNWEHGVGPCTCAVLESLVPNKKWQSADAGLAYSCDRYSRPAKAISVFKEKPEIGLMSQNDTPHAVNVTPQTRMAQLPGDFSSGSSQKVFKSQQPGEPYFIIQQNQHAYPCIYPVNSYMRSTVSRLDNFTERNWMRLRLAAAMIDDIFFLLGERECLKCSCCNGRLHYEPPKFYSNNKRYFY